MSGKEVDEEILELSKSRDTEDQAFQAMYKAYAKRLYWHIRRLVLNHDDTDDILQDVFVKAWKGLRNFRGDAQLYTWLYRIASNESMTFLSKSSKKQTLPLEGAMVYQAGECTDGPDGDLILKKLELALQTLPDKQRLVFNMRYYDEMTYQQISEVLGTSVGALKASYHHAATKIEKYLTQND